MRVKNYGPANCNKIFCIHKRKYHLQTNKTQTPAQTPRGTFFAHVHSSRHSYHIFEFFNYRSVFSVGRDSSVSAETRYGLDDQGIESRWGGEIFPSCPDQPWGPPCTMGTKPFPEGKAAGT
jgi:hypothetical protein